MDKKEKSFRLLELHEVLNKGAFISKTELANLFCVSEKTIQRDIDELRAYLAEKHEADTSICYDKSTNSYMLLRSERDWLTNEEVLAMLIDRMNYLQKLCPCRENAIVITKLEESLMWLNKRTAERKARNVEGKHIA